MDIAGGAAGKLEEAALSAINEPGAKRQSMEQRYSVVILTDPRNVIEERLALNDKNELVVVDSETVVGGHTEDQIIADFLSQGFSVTLRDYRDSLDGIKADLSRKLSILLYILSDGSFWRFCCDVSNHAFYHFHFFSRRRARRWNGW